MRQSIPTNGSGVIEVAVRYAVAVVNYRILQSIPLDHEDKPPFGCVRPNRSL